MSIAVFHNFCGKRTLRETCGCKTCEAAKRTAFAVAEKLAKEQEQ